jgi:hypothetical protein
MGWRIAAKYLTYELSVVMMKDASGGCLLNLTVQMDKASEESLRCTF